LKAFHDEKDYRKRGGPPRATGYENALRAIAACTTKYAHPKELLVLTGVGPTCVERRVFPLCISCVRVLTRPRAVTRLFRLTEKLEEHCARRGIEMPEFKKKERGQLRVSL
jgi:hypothetical protein